MAIYRRVERNADRSTAISRRFDSETLLPTGFVIVKIAAIEHRSKFTIPKNGGDRIGLELGADLSADLNLDDFLVFDNDQDRSVRFFKDLLFKNYESVAENEMIVHSSDELIRSLFTQMPVFSEFVRAVEGVPRDALNLASKVATRAFGQSIGMEHVRRAALDWYQQDKVAVVRANKVLDRVLNLVIDEVIGERKARAFLFPANQRNEIIDRLFDSRILHLLKKNISAREEPGKRYDAWKIDYGCYVDLINTQKAPQGLFETEDGFVEVPVDDYRSIRRAVLSPERLDEFVHEAEAAG